MAITEVGVATSPEAGKDAVETLGCDKGAQNVVGGSIFDCLKDDTPQFTVKGPGFANDSGNALPAGHPRSRALRRRSATAAPEPSGARWRSRWSRRSATGASDATGGTRYGRDPTARRGRFHPFRRGPAIAPDVGSSPGEHHRRDRSARRRCRRRDAGLHRTPLGSLVRRDSAQRGHDTVDHSGRARPLAGDERGDGDGRRREPRRGADAPCARRALSQRRRCETTVDAKKAQLQRANFHAGEAAARATTSPDRARALRYLGWTTALLTDPAKGAALLEESPGRAARRPRRAVVPRHRALRQAERRRGREAAARATPRHAHLGHAASSSTSKARQSERRPLRSVGQLVDDEVRGCARGQSLRRSPLACSSIRLRRSMSGGSFSGDRRSPPLTRSERFPFRTTSRLVLRPGLAE